MATPSTAAVPVSPDTLITVKVSYNAGIRRFKLPLRELGPSVLPGKLRSALSIPEGQKVVFERYSDSAGAFIVLDSTIPSVYKQLYRAAKAKLKLRLKATVDGAAGIAAVSSLPTYSQISLLSPPPEVPAAATAPVAPIPAPAPPAELDTIKINKAVADAIMNYVKSEEYNNKLQRSISEEVAKQSRAASVASSVAPSMCSLPAFAPTENRGIAIERPLNTPSVPCGFQVYCNKCNGAVSGAHYHCSSCDGGDFDLCESCVEKGEHCDKNHWLIKRHLKDGQFVTSTTEAAPKPKTPVVEKAPAFQSRTCNSCVASLPEECFVTCTACEDYDVCLPCLSTSKHGHHPLHAFEPATKNTLLQTNAQDLLAPGRGVKHHAICDGCDATIYGVRHKCLECPDWDYCSSCYKSVELLHTGHRFVPLYEAYNLCTVASKIVHTGIYCDGHLCVDKPRWIIGDRYHCAVCNDVDFCAMCEAHPGNPHNRTHPLIKLKTPVRNLTCATEETQPDVVPRTSLLGDVRGFQRDNLRPTTHAATQVQTVADVEPEMENLTVNEKVAEAVEEDEFLADFVTDTVEDGTLMAPSQKFSQTWTLKNTGRVAWPAGVSVRYVGGDQMFGTGSEDEFGRTILLEEVAVGETAEFTVNLIAPEFPRRRCISYWRLSAPDGQCFGHKLWCDIEVEEQDEPIVVKKEAQDVAEDATVKGEESLEHSVSSAASEMVFPTLDKESVILEREEPVQAEKSPAETGAESTATAPVEAHSIMHSPAWTLAMSEGDDMTSDVATSEDDVESLMLDDEDYEVLETSDDDGYNRVI